jgi:hypothetical protein
MLVQNGDCVSDPSPPKLDGELVIANNNSSWIWLNAKLDKVVKTIFMISNMKGPICRSFPILHACSFQIQVGHDS